ncbi:MAG: PaaI family thioesterase [Micrococcales bacterium]|nr:PaaI family thioesterase [Micrococcales bacterium]
MSEPTADEIADWVAERGLGELADSMGIKIVSLSGEAGVATMPAEGNRQPLGIVHGGAYVVIAETLGSMCATLAAGPNRHAVGIEINASHTKSCKSGLITATCKAVNIGKNLATHEIQVTDDQGNRLSTVRITNFLRDNR